VDQSEALGREFNDAVQSPELRERLLKLGADPLTMSLANFEAMIKQELEENAALIKAAGIKVN
jgi:tripartite-type tricarboxylate transporter receptor subunit TctC